MNTATPGHFFLNNKAARIIVSFIKKTINIIAKSNSAALLIHWSNRLINFDWLNPDMMAPEVSLFNITSIFYRIQK